MADRIFPEETLNTRTLGATGLSTGTPEGQFTLARQTAQTTGESVLTLSAKIKALLGQYQQAGQVQQAQGVQEQVRRGTAPLPADLAGAQLSPSQILGFRRGEVGAVQPTIGGARQQIQEAESAISRLTDFERTYSEGKLKALNLQQQLETKSQDDAQKAIDTAIDVGSEALEGLIQRNPDLIKTAKYNKETIDAFVKGLKRKEAREIALEQSLIESREEKEPTIPTSYREWELAGSPGTYENFLKTRKPVTDAQRILAGYASRIEQSNPILKSLEKSIQGLNVINFETQIKLPAALQSSLIQQYMQATRNFINAVLRRESGAVISPSEFSEARKQYLPQPGDSPEVLVQKVANRNLIFNSYKVGAGEAYQSIEELIGEPGQTILKGGRTLEVIPD